jgi:hypothetical protein
MRRDDRPPRRRLWAAQYFRRHSAAHGDAGRVDQRRHDQEKHEFRRKLHPRKPRRHRKDEPDENEENRGGDSGPIRGADGLLSRPPPILRCRAFQ